MLLARVGHPRPKGRLQLHMPTDSNPNSLKVYRPSAKPRASSLALVNPEMVATQMLRPDLRAMATGHLRQRQVVNRVPSMVMPSRRSHHMALGDIIQDLRRLDPALDFLELRLVVLPSRRLAVRGIRLRTEDHHQVACQVVPHLIRSLEHHRSLGHHRSLRVKEGMVRMEVPLHSQVVHLIPTDMGMGMCMGTELDLDLGVRLDSLKMEDTILVGLLLSLVRGLASLEVLLEVVQGSLIQPQGSPESRHTVDLEVGD